ncbi:MAG: hypothetical protein ACFE9L_21775, partial [Candidatus Hodarchaeota archaeon]
RLQEINTQEDNKIIDQRSRIAKALVLKSSTQAQNQTQAKALLKQLAEEEVVDHGLTVLALLNVCDMLLAELELSNVQEQLQVVHPYVNKLLAIAQHQNSHWLLASTYVLRARVLFIELRHLWSFEKLQELNITLQQIQQWGQAKQLFIILAQAHLLLALFYHTRLFFDEVKAELKKAEAIIDQRNLFNERQKLEAISQQIQTSKATYLAMLTQGFEHEQHKLKIAEFEQDFMNTIDAYFRAIKPTIATLVNT